MESGDNGILGFPLIVSGASRATAAPESASTAADIKKERPGSPKPLFLKPDSHYPAHARHAAR